MTGAADNGAPLMRVFMARSLIGLLAAIFGLGCGNSAERAKEEEFHSFVEECGRELEYKMDKVIEKYNLDNFTSYKFDQTKGSLVLADEAGNEIVCKIQIVGTYSNASNTWLWAWDSGWVVDELARDSKVVRDYGVQHGFDELTTGKWNAEEADGWAMTAVTAKLVSAEAAYRLPNRQSLIFMVIKELESRPRGN